MVSLTFLNASSFSCFSFLYISNNFYFRALFPSSFDSSSLTFVSSLPSLTCYVVKNELGLTAALNVVYGFWYYACIMEYYFSKLSNLLSYLILYFILSINSTSLSVISNFNASSKLIGLVLLSLVLIVFLAGFLKTWIGCSSIFCVFFSAFFG